MEVKTIDNSIENLIITGMIVDSKFFRDVFRATKPEYFNAEVSKILVRWLREYYDSLYPKLDKDAIEGTEYYRKEKIEFVFDSEPKSIAMWRRRGVFVFNCCQHDEEI